MLITARGACPLAHPGCEYCMGSKATTQHEIYQRPALIMDNDTLIHHLEQISGKFQQMSLFINSPCDYDFTGHFFDIEATIEIDSPNKPADLARILPAFRKAIVHNALYQEGLMGQQLRDDVAAFHELEDENHKIYFFAFDEDTKNTYIPPNRRLYAEVILPHWTNWDFYNDRANAMQKSREWYMVTRQTNLFPLPRQIGMKIGRGIFFQVAYVLNKLKMINLKSRLV
jgi:hypothetical protein